MTPFQKQVKQVAIAAGFEKIVCKTNGIVEIVREYYFRPTGGAPAHAEQVAKVLQDAGITTEIGIDDRFGRRLSKLVAIVKPV